MSTEERPPKDFDHRFFQQKLPHVYAHVSTQAVVLCSFLIAVVFIPVGAAAIIASDSVYELDVRYDAVHQCTATSNQGIETFDGDNGTTISTGCVTNVVFTLDKTLVAPIYIYYRVNGFHQNYRLYAKSIDQSQLQGTEVTRDAVSDCDPFIGPTNDMLYEPCGTIAWSMFNDTISLFKVDDTTAATLTPSSAMPAQAEAICVGDAFSPITNMPTNETNCQKDGIAFPQDVESRFTAPVHESTTKVRTGLGLSNSSGNLYDRNGWYNNEPGHKIPLISDQDFMVWSRIATLADFRKPYRKITVDLTRGTYVWSITERFDTTSIAAEKHVILATVGWIGGKNHVLGALYITMGSISLLLAFAFVGMHIARAKE
jgi:hypothetical protein